MLNLACAVESSEALAEPDPGEPDDCFFLEYTGFELQRGHIRVARGER